MTALKFHDVSHYQGDYTPTGPTIAKATEGTTFTDARYATTRDRTLAGGWPFAGYHFLRHGVDITAQAKHAYSVIGKLPAMLDVETASVDGSKATLAETLAFIDAYRALGGVLYLVYLPHWYWQMWGSPSLKPLLDRGCVLISSNYTTYSDTGPGWDPYGGMAPGIWQYTSTPIDTNAFKGTQSQLGKLFTTGGTAMDAADAKTLLYTDDLIKPSAAVIAASSDTSNTGWTLHGTLEWLVNHVFTQQAALADLQAKIAALPTTAVPAAPLDAPQLAAIAAAVLDEQHRRDAS